jgi:hypothetical protein
MRESFGVRRSTFIVELLDRDDRRLGVERVDDRLDQQQIAAPSIRPRACSLNASFNASGHVAERRVVDVGQIERMRLVGPIDPATKRAATRSRCPAHAAQAAWPPRVQLVDERFST